MIKEAVLSVLPDLAKLQEAPIKDELGNILGWHSNVILEGRRIAGSGTHSDRAMSRTIALSEAMERRMMTSLQKSENVDRLLLSEYPTSCGFAFGFDREATRDRALAEGVERWLRSKWIDEHFCIPNVPKTEVSPQLNPLGRLMADLFENVGYFQTTNTMIVRGELVEFFSCIVVGIKGQGAFVGSRTSLSSHDLWTHALIEAWRHLIIFERSTERDRPDLKSIFYFGTHKKEALHQVELACIEPFPEPSLRLLEEVNTHVGGFYCFRALCHDFQGWHGENYQRFVY